MRHALVPTTFLSVTGDDRVDFVSGLVTGNVRNLAAGEAVRSLMLNYRGHALAELTTWRLDDSLLLAVHDGQGELVRTEFEGRIIFDQVEISDVTDSHALLTVLDWQDGTDVPDGVLAQASARRSQSPAIDLVLSGDGAAQAAALAALGSVPVSLAELELERIRAGIPSAVRDAGAGVLPQESGLEPLVSYRKGCYLGQEIMARIEARGNMRRQLTAVALSGEPAEGERDILLEGRRVGRLGSVTRDPELGWLGLAVLRNDLDAGANLEVGGVRAVSRALSA